VVQVDAEFNWGKPTKKANEQVHATLSGLAIPADETNN
jgi:hypothetical protein